MPQTIQIKRGLDANVAALTLLAGEPAFTTDTGKLYVGTGSSKTLINPTLGTAATANTGTASGNIPVLGADGKLADSVIPKIAVTDTFVVASQVAMLALTAEVGDVAVRTDENKTYILQTSPASVLANWTQLLFPSTATVSSVNGLTGSVVLTGANVNVTGYTIASTATPITATDSVNVALGKLEKADSLKATIDSPTFTGTPTAPTPTTTDNTTKLATTAFVKAQGYITSASAPVTTVNTKTGAVVLDPRDLLMTGYAIGTSAAAIAVTDTASAAIGKLEFGKAPLASPTFTGTPAAPTATAGTNTTQIATTAFVQTALGVIDGGTF